DDPTPPAVPPVLVGQRAQGGAGAVGHAEVRGEPHPSPGGADAVVHLPVLGAGEVGVVATDPLERLPAEDPEVDRVRLSRTAAGVEAGATDAERALHRAGD